MRPTLTLVLALACATHAVAQKEPQRPNVLFLFADDQRPDAVGAFGNPHIRTPHVDSLAARGFRFSSAYCMGSIHGAVCQPSRAMLMSGRSLWRVSMKLDGVPTMPQTFRKSGYETFGTGKWHNGGDSFRRCFERGKSVMLGGMSDHTRVPIRDLGKDDFTDKRDGEKFSSELFADAADRVPGVAGTSQEDPFFLLRLLHAPRTIHGNRREDWRRALLREPPSPARRTTCRSTRSTTVGWRGRDESLAAWPRTPEVVSDQLAEYYGMITHMDEQIGRILQALEDSAGLAGEHDRRLHGGPRARGRQPRAARQAEPLRALDGCPLIFAGPGIPHGREPTALTYLLRPRFRPCATRSGDPTFPQGVEGNGPAGRWDVGERPRACSATSRLHDLREQDARGARRGGGS